MRVIAGKYRSRKLLSIPGTEVRPTPDKMRETLFDILGPSIAGKVFVDACAGTGAVGIEALSRGARQVILIEKNRDVCDLIRANLSSLKIGREARLIQGGAAIYLTRVPADIVFIDPPYPKEKEYEASLLAISSLEQLPSLVIAQHSSRFALQDVYGKLTRTRIVKQGENSLSFYRPTEEPVSAEPVDAAATAVPADSAAPEYPDPAPEA
jgi:16S rRNA (guanine966-N2)-methyltransferase